MSRPDDYGIVAEKLRRAIIRCENYEYHREHKQPCEYEKALAALERLAEGDHTRNCLCHANHFVSHDKKDMNLCRRIVENHPHPHIDSRCIEFRRDCLAKVRG